MAEGPSDASGPGASAPSAAEPGQSCVHCAYGGVPLGTILVVLGIALDDSNGRDTFLGPDEHCIFLGVPMLLVGLVAVWLTSVGRLLFTERGSLWREARTAAGATALPCLILAVLLLQSRGLPPPPSVGPGWLIPPGLAFVGTVLVAGWLLVFAWRVRRPVAGGEA
jgi:hypothetical protein